MVKKMVKYMLAIFIITVIHIACRKSFDIETMSSKLTITIDQVNVFYDRGIINIVPSVTNFFIPRVETFGICWAINNNPSITTFKSERNISDNSQLNPDIIGLGFDIEFNVDTIYVVKAFVTFNDSLIYYSQSKSIDIKDYH